MINGWLQYEWKWQMINRRLYLIRETKSVFTYPRLRSFPNSIFLFVLSIVHTFLFALILFFLNWGSYWSIVFLLVFTDHIFIALVFFLLLHLLRRILQLANIGNSKFLQILRLPLFSLLLFSLYYVWIKCLAILTDWKLFIVVHWYFYIF